MPLKPYAHDRFGSAVAYGDLRGRVQELEISLSQHGLSLPPESRFLRYRIELERAQRVVEEEVSHPLSLDLPLLHRAAYEVSQLVLIVDELSRPPAVHGWEQGVRKILRGRSLPTQGGKSEPRDIQFELFTAALCRKAGYEVELAEPDVIVYSKSGKFALAAKRPSSSKRLSKTVRMASSQIVGSRIPGIVALDVSQIINPTFVLLFAPHREAALTEVTRRVNNFINHYRHAIRSQVDLGMVFGLMILMEALTVVGEPRQLGSATRWTLENLCQMGDPRTALLQDLAVRLAEVAY